MTERQAALTSFHEYQLRLEGDARKTQEAWERSRWELWQHMLLSPYVKPGQKAKTPQDFCRFAWEKREMPDVSEVRITKEMNDTLNGIINKRKDNG